MKRRDFISLLGGAAAWPVAAHAQQPERMRRIGMLIAFFNDSEFQGLIKAFRQSLEAQGWVEGKMSNSTSVGLKAMPVASRRWPQKWLVRRQT